MAADRPPDVLGVRPVGIGAPGLGRHSPIQQGPLDSRGGQRGSGAVVRVSEGGLERAELIRQLQRKAAAELHEIGVAAPFSLLDFPDERNVGDSAIWLGATAYFREHRGVEPGYVASIRALLRGGPPGVGSGGADLHSRREGTSATSGPDTRVPGDLLERFPDREIIQLPQSIHFHHPKRSSEPPVRSRVTGNSGCWSAISPPTSSRPRTSIARSGCARTWPSSSAPWSARCARRWTSLSHAHRQGARVQSADRAAGLHLPDGRLVDGEPSFRPGTQAGRASSVGCAAAGPAPPRCGGAVRGRRLGAGGPWLPAPVVRGRVVITDRLHAHILCLLLGIPHAVLDNNYGKLSRFLDAWTGEATGVYRASSTEEAERWARIGEGKARC